ncbi:Chlorophyllase [Corchorus capsularis]|uniref:Chlorophyllase n=1 Tax=Corchorus capsularis TaxID=210143 RepID=A0A1R3I4Y6_COCAP|nr:Chlorophyllase [Corchorus capsularis]
MAQLLETKPVLSTDVPVFQPGKYNPSEIDTSSSPSPPPKPVLIYAPSEPGNYPVLLFFHGFLSSNRYYSDLLKFTSSHGFIVVAPQLYNLNPLNPMNLFHLGGCEELKFAVEVASWLKVGLRPPVLPGDVIANLEKVALAGHSRGGKTAFTIALGVGCRSPETPKCTQTFSALIGIDPVAGVKGPFGITNITQPEILTHDFDMSIPVTVIGTGLGPESKVKGLFPACAPEGLNHKDFFNKCRPPCAHFVAEKYGHTDIFNDDSQLDIIGKADCLACVNNKGPRGPMRRCVGGIVVAFLNYYFHDEKEDFMTIVNDPNVAPVKLDEVEFNI